MELILASQSPRRQELMKLIGLNYRVVVSDVEENAPDGLSPGEYVRYLAHVKAEAVYKMHPLSCVIGADTIVNLGGEVIGKPKDAEDAKRILHKLQGKSHIVHTGLAVLKNGYQATEQEETHVTFSPMTDGEIDWYVKTGEPLDKAGAYGIQGPGGIFVSRVEGNYFNVIGLPLPLLYRMLKDAGVWKGAVRI